MIRFALRIISRSFSWTIALLTAWYRDGFVRSSERDTKAWDALDRLQRWLSVGFWVLVLSWVAAPGLLIPDFGQGADATFWIEVGLTALLSWFVFAILARRIVVSNRHISWGFAQMPTDLKLALFPKRPRRVVLQDGVEQEVASNESIWASLERALRKGFGFVVVPAFVLAVPVAMLLPHFLPETAAFLNPLAVWIVLIPTLTLGVVAGTAQSVGVASDAAAKVRMLSPVRAAFGGSDAEYQRSRFRIRGHNLYVSNAPAVVFSDLQRSDAALGGVAPDWQLSPLTDAAQRRLVLEKAHPDTVASRALLADSNGLLIGVADEPNSVERPEAVRYLLADGVSPSRYAEVDAILSRTVARFDDGTVRDVDPLRVVEWRPESREAIAARIPRHTAALRDAIAPYLRVQPHDVEITTDLDDTGRITEVNVLRYPRTDIDQGKREELWAGILVAETSRNENEVWLCETDPDGTMHWALREDPLAGVQSYPWDAPLTMDAIPFSVAEDGAPVALKVYESNILVGGIPGSGKSGASTAILAGVARLPHTAIYGIDLKRVELSPWKPRFEEIAKTDQDALDLLRRLHGEMMSRYEWLEGNGLKKLSPATFTDEKPLIVLVIDELAQLVQGGDKNLTDEVKEILRQLVALGRAAGVTVITMTQKPETSIIPSAFRDLLAQRVAFATTTREMTDTVLGSGVSQSGGDAHLIPQALKGVNFLTNEESRVPRRTRAYWVPDEEVAGIAERTADLRIGLRLSTPSDTTALRDAFDDGWDDFVPERRGATRPDAEALAVDLSDLEAADLFD